MRSRRHPRWTIDARLQRLRLNGNGHSKIRARESCIGQFLSNVRSVNLHKTPAPRCNCDPAAPIHSFEPGHPRQSRCFGFYRILWWRAIIAVLINVPPGSFCYLSVKRCDSAVRAPASKRIGARPLIVIIAPIVYKRTGRWPESICPEIGRLTYETEKREGQ